MSFDKAFIDLVRDRIGIVDFISKKIPLTRKGKEHWGVCPFHGEKTASFAVSEGKNFYHCFGCGAHGDIITFLMQTEHISFIEALELLCSEAGLEMPKATAQQKELDKKSHDLYEVLILAIEFFKAELYLESGKSALEYLYKRGLSDEVISSFHLCYAPIGNKLLKYLENKKVPLKLMIEAGLVRISEKSNQPYDYFRDRVLFPITDSRGRVIAFGGRVMDDGLPKYLNSPESVLFSKGRSLYGLAQARNDAIENNRVIACEGYMDTIALHRFGFKCAVAPLGTAITETQIDILWKLAEVPVLCFDSDIAGRKASVRAALRVLPILRPSKSLKFCLVEGAKDPDEFLCNFGVQKFKDLLDKSISLSELLWRYFTVGKDISTPEAKAGLQSDIRKELARIKDDSIREHYLHDFMERIKSSFRVSLKPIVKKVVVDANEASERMALAFAVAYPSKFLKLLEEGMVINFKGLEYKDIFDKVKVEVMVNPHTRDTMYKFLEMKGINIKAKLKFEIESLVLKPDVAEFIMVERILKLRLDNLKIEMDDLTRQMFSLSGDNLDTARQKIEELKSEVELVQHKISEIG